MNDLTYLYDTLRAVEAALKKRDRSREEEVFLLEEVQESIKLLDGILYDTQK